MESKIKYRGEVYGFVNQRNGYTAYRCVSNPRKEVIVGPDGKPTEAPKKIKRLWQETK